MRYNNSMVEIEIGTNEKGQRFDRFLRKYLPKAPLSLIYRIVRKDAKVNMKRVKDDYDLKEGDIVQLYLSEEDIESFRRQDEPKQARKTFRVAYEDDDILIADKPAGILTHGDRSEKADHLTNQVQGYLMAKGGYDPSAEKTFAPSPVNRIDRNTSGLVIFAKNYDTLKKFNEYIRNREKIRKFYMTVVYGKLDRELTLSGMIEKDESRNVSRMTDQSQTTAYQSQTAGAQSHTAGAQSQNAGAQSQTAVAKAAVTHVKPLMSGTINGKLGSQDGIQKAGGKQSSRGGIPATLCEVEIETGRTHQIRVQLAEAGHPLLGDPKYGKPEVNKTLRESYGLTHQLLTAARLEFGDMSPDYPGLSGRSAEAKLPQVFTKIKKDIK